MNTTPAAQPDDAATAGEPALWEDTRRLAHLLDSQFRVPGTERRFGIDGLMGLIPGLGDATGLVMASVVIAHGISLGARGWTVARMVLNATIDAVFGSIPVLGWLFDFGFKANQRNVALIERHVADPAGTGRRSRRTVIATVAATVLVGLLLVAAAAAALIWLLAAIF